ncbi:MAG: DnaJ family domain-containing protein [Alphaproteobacteria bacterium]
MKRPTQPTGAVPLFERIAEQRILEAQRKGEFDDLPGKGKPLEIEDLSWVPEDLRIGYHILKNAHVLPPEAELRKDIYTIEDLLKHVADEGERRALAKSLQWKLIRLDLLKRRSLSLDSLRHYSAKIVAKLRAK